MNDPANAQQPLTISQVTCADEERIATDLANLPLTPKSDNSQVGDTTRNDVQLLAHLCEKFFISGNISDVDAAIWQWRRLIRPRNEDGHWQDSFVRWLPRFEDPPVCRAAAKQLLLRSRDALEEILPILREVSHDAQEATMIIWLVDLCMSSLRAHNWETDREEIPEIVSYIDIDGVIEYGNIALRAVEGQKPAETLVLLLCDLIARSPRQHRIDGFTEAIRIAQGHLDAAEDFAASSGVGPRYTDSREADLHATLSSYYLRRYEVGSAESDLRTGHRIAVKGFELPSPRDTNVESRCRVILAESLKFESQASPQLGREEKLQRLDKAISLVRPLVDSSSAARCLMSLWRLRFRRTENLDDWETGLAVIDELETSSRRRDDTQLSVQLGFERGESYFDLFRLKHGNLDAVPSQPMREELIGDLNEAIAFMKSAIQAAPPNHFWTFRLAQALERKYQVTKDVKFKRKAVREMRRAYGYADGHISGTRLRIRCLHALSRIFGNDQEWDACFEHLRQAVTFLRRACRGSSFTKADQQEHVREFRSLLPSYACSAAILSGQRPENALELLEEGRAIIASILTPNDDDIAKLKEVHPGLHAQYIDLNDRLSSTEDAEQVRVAHAGLDSLEDNLRSREGFHRFQLGPDASEMVKLASCGPVVAFNITKWASHALVIVPNDGVHCLKLEEMDHAELSGYHKSLTHEEKSKRINYCSSIRRWAEKNGEMKKLLAWLWDKAVWPIIDFLHTQLPEFRATTEPLPRIFWMATGLMSPMPLHAAGIYGDWEGGERSTSQFVVSTYVTSLRTLELSRKRRLMAGDALSRPLLFVGMPKTAGEWSDLSAVEEAEAVSSAYKASDAPIDPEILQNPSKEGVLGKLADSHMVHFVCHGQPDARDPSRGGLLLGQQPKAEEPDHLSAAELSDHLGPKDSLLAYLSACSTAENLTPALADESIYMASSLQLLGFHNVVGTQWEVNNKWSVSVAKEFHTELLRLCSRLDNFSECVARALHHAVKELKSTKKSGGKSNLANVLLWGPFVHIGA